MGGIPRPDLQPSEAIFAIRLFIGLIPGFGLLIEILILQLYLLRGEYWANIQKKILIIHDEKHKKYLEMEQKNKLDKNQQ